MNLTYNMALGTQMMGVLLVVAGTVAGHLLRKQEAATLRSQKQSLQAVAERARDHLEDPNAPRWITKGLEKDIKNFLRAHPPVIMHFGALKNQREAVTFALSLQKVCYGEGWSSSFQIIDPIPGAPVPVNVWITGEPDYREAFAHILRIHGIKVEHVGASLDGWSYGYDDAGLGVYVGLKGS
ncbi:MAG TPA: hypothetical protein VLE43_11600 [Candidatus Saccharimonadia bacterium]|nr:hypothetical protein [Candidatus Saccharimonadia bacterium]